MEEISVPRARRTRFCTRCSRTAEKKTLGEMRSRDGLPRRRSIQRIRAENPPGTRRPLQQLFDEADAQWQELKTLPPNRREDSPQRGNRKECLDDPV